jgi:NADPH:quinone reductase-like Zn-dependent oxidoreductase
MLSYTPKKISPLPQSASRPAAASMRLRRGRARHLHPQHGFASPARAARALWRSDGLVPPIDPRELLFRKSLFLTRTGLDHYIADRRELRARTDELFAWAAEGRLKQKVFRTYRLEEAADAHRAIESRGTTGKLLVIP